MRGWMLHTLASKTWEWGTCVPVHAEESLRKYPWAVEIGYIVINWVQPVRHTLRDSFSHTATVRNHFSSTLAVLASFNASTDSHERYGPSSREPANMLVNIPRIQGRRLWKRCENAALGCGTKYARRFDYGGTGFQRLCWSINLDLLFDQSSSLKHRVSFPTWLLALREMNVAWQLGIIHPSNLWISTSFRATHLWNQSASVKCICSRKKSGEVSDLYMAFARRTVCKASVHSIDPHRWRSFKHNKSWDTNAMKFQCLPLALLTRRHFAWKSPLKQRGVPLCPPGTTFQHPCCAPTSRHDTQVLSMCAAL